MDFSQMLNPQAPMPAPTAPAPAPLAQPAPQMPAQGAPDKRAAWSQLLEDPNMKSALFRMGLQMMQGTRQGESALGATARAGMGAMDYYGAKNELDRKRAIDADKTKLDTANVNSQIAGRDVQTAVNTEELSQSKSKFTEYEAEKGNRAKRAQLEIQNLERTGDYEKARLRKTELELDEAQKYADFITANPKLAADANTAKLRKPLLENAQTIAQTNSSNASAANSSASAANTRQKTSQDKAEFDAAPTWIAALPDDEAKSYAMANKGVKSQPEIEADLRNKLHHGFNRSKTGTANTEDYSGLASSILQEYKTADKKMYPTVDQYITSNFNVTLGKSASGVIAEVKRLQAAEGTTGKAPALNFVRDKSGKLVPQK